MSNTDGFASPTGIDWRGDVGVVEYGGGSRNLVVFFYNKAVHNTAKSAERGKPVFDNKVFVRIAPPGERLNIVEREATVQDKQRFPMQWEAHRKKKDQQPEGVPIELLYPEQPSIAATLRANNVQTVEQLANLSGVAIDSIGMGTQSWVNYAKRYLDAATKGANQSQLRHEREKSDRTIKALERQVSDLKARLDQLVDNRTMAPDLAQIQTMLSNLMQRPVHVPQQTFDPQSSMIDNRAQERGAQQTRRQRPRIRG